VEPVFLGQRTNIHQNSAAGNLCGMEEPSRQELLAEQHSKSFITLMIDSRQLESKHKLLGILFWSTQLHEHTHTHKHTHTQARRPRHEMTTYAYTVRCRTRIFHV